MWLWLYAVVLAVYIHGGDGCLYYVWQYYSSSITVYVHGGCGLSWPKVQQDVLIL